MIKSKIFYRFNLILKTIVLIWFIYEFIIAVFNTAIYGFDVICFFFIIFSVGILLYFIIFCEFTDDYQKFNNSYFANLIAEITVAFNFILLIIFSFYYLFIYQLILTICALLIGIKYYFVKKAEISKEETIIVDPKILLNINIVLKSFTTIVIIIWIFQIIPWDDFWGIHFPTIIFLFIGFTFRFIIINCYSRKKYKNFRNSYFVSLIGDLIVIIYFTYVLLFEVFYYNNITALSYPNSLLLFSLLMISMIALILGLKYFFLKRRSLEFKPSSENLEKLKDILTVSNRMKLERVQNVLNLDDKVFNSKIIEWAKEFGFRIDGEYLIVNKESIAEFIEALDNKFIEWEKREKDKSDKL